MRNGFIFLEEIPGIVRRVGFRTKIQSYRVEKEAKASERISACFDIGTLQRKSVAKVCIKEEQGIIRASKIVKANRESKKNNKPYKKNKTHFKKNLIDLSKL